MLKKIACILLFFLLIGYAYSIEGYTNSIHSMNTFGNRYNEAVETNMPEFLR